MSAAALKLAQNVFGDLSKTRLLLIGVGEMVELAATYFVAQRPKSVVVANRTLAHAKDLATRLALNTRGVVAVDNQLVVADHEPDASDKEVVKQDVADPGRKVHRFDADLSCRRAAQFEVIAEVGVPEPLRRARAAVAAERPRLGIDGRGGGMVV